ncbi:MAG: hypothetical protein CMQ44_05530 [Gammaproteobacteria bacterium]|nr:hypothetical protein [Gammaproteobacteria bacterium]|tara:strand:- start:9580 stop:10488 length:909 start_codon:yes stop_codon:yes gene_type:complete
MRIGISISSSHRVEDPRVGARFMIERARVARQVDLDSLFVGDHHVTANPYYQNTPMLGRLLAEWHNKPAGALYLLPLWHPVLLAEQIATLAAIMPGRFIMQCGLGWDPAQSAGMGVDMTKRAAMFESSLEVMQRLWAGETVSEDRFWHIRDARIAPLPANNVEVWVGAGAPAALHRTARMAEGWIATPSLGRAAAAQQLNQYRQACAEYERTPRAVAIRRDIFIGDDQTQAQRFKQRMIDKGYRGFAEEAILAGTVATVAAEFAALAELGFTDIIVRNMSSEQSEALATIERLAEVKQVLNL